MKTSITIIAILIVLAVGFKLTHMKGTSVTATSTAATSTSATSTK